MPFRTSFDCLWCGTHHDVRSDGDLEGWASLCPTCVGRADDNGFLRTRLRTALRERSSAAAGPAAAEPVAAGIPAASLAPPSASKAAPVTPAPVTPAPVTPAPVTPASGAATSAVLRPDGSASGATDYDDWYMRRGRFSAGPIVDQPWQMELDEATRWLDAVPMDGVIVELGAGAGWWSTLLAGKGELWMFEPDEPALEAARRRLVAHGLLAHLHVREPLAAPERAADVVFAAYLLGPAIDDADLVRRLDVVRAWLRPGGTFVFIEGRPPDAAPDADPITVAEGPGGPLRLRRSGELAAMLASSGLAPQTISSTPSAFMLGSAIAQP